MKELIGRRVKCPKRDFTYNTDDLNTYVEGVISYIEEGFFYINFGEYGVHGRSLDFLSHSLVPKSLEEELYEAKLRVKNLESKMLNAKYYEPRVGDVVKAYWNTPDDYQLGVITKKDYATAACGSIYQINGKDWHKERDIEKVTDSAIIKLYKI